MTVITILGAGVMGSAMCLPAHDNGHEIRLVGTSHDAAVIDGLMSNGRHLKLNAMLPRGVKFHHQDKFDEALGDDTGLLVLGISSAGVGWAIDRLCEAMRQPVPIVMITKGMHSGDAGLETLPHYVQSRLQQRRGMDVRIAAIGGPCIAGELAVRRQTGTVIASEDSGFARELCALFETSYYHPRASSDVIGVEVCAAFKNFFAIAVGWAAGQLDRLAATDNRAANHNAAAVIFDQAIAEMLRLVEALGGQAASVWGMPGAGDLYVTCLAGRNSRLGSNLGRGLTYSEVREGPMKGDTIEGAELGVAVAGSLRAMMEKGRPDPKAMPLTIALLDALAENQTLNIPWTEFHRHS